MIDSSNTEIFLAEDNPQDLQLTLRAFDKARIGCRIHVARDGEEFLHKLFGQEITPGQLRLILLDLKLPKIDGLELLRVIKADARTQPIPVVILSSSTEQSDIRSSYQLGANSYVVKPVNFELFAGTVRALGNYWIHHNQPLSS